MLNSCFQTVVSRLASHTFASTDNVVKDYIDKLKELREEFYGRAQVHTAILVTRLSKQCETMGMILRVLPDLRGHS